MDWLRELRGFIPAPVKGALVGLAGLVLWGSDLAGISHPTVAKKAAEAVLVLFAADAVTKNDRGAKAAAAVAKSKTMNGAVE